MMQFPCSRSSCPTSPIAKTLHEYPLDNAGNMCGSRSNCHWNQTIKMYNRSLVLMKILRQRGLNVSTVCSGTLRARDALARFCCRDSEAFATMRKHVKAKI